MLHNALKSPYGLRESNSVAKSPRCEKNSGLVFLRLLTTGRREGCLDACYSLLARVEAEPEDAGCGDETVQRFLTGIRNHQAVGAASSSQRSYYCVPRAREITKLVHNLTQTCAVKIDVL